MPSLDEMKGRMAQRMNPNAAGGGLPPAGAPSSAQSGGQYPPGAGSGTEPTPGFAETLDNVMQTLLQGNPADMELFGAFMAELEQIVREHQQSAGAGAGAGAGAPQPQAQPAPPMA